MRGSRLGCQVWIMNIMNGDSCMFKKIFKIHKITLLLGVLLFLTDFSLKEFFGILQFSTYLKISSGLCFIITMFCYSKLIITLKKVTNITNMQVILAISSHILTLLAIFNWNVVKISVSFAFIGSILIRRFFGITEIDNQMKDLCEQLDFELYKIGKIQEKEEKNQRIF